MKENSWRGMRIHSHRQHHRTYDGKWLGEGTNLHHFFFLLLALEMDLVEVFLNNTIWLWLFRVVMVLKPSEETPEESDGSGIAGDVSTKVSRKLLSSCSCWED